MTRLNIGGVGRHALLLTKGLGQKGFDTYLFSGREGAREGSLEPGNVVHMPIPTLRRGIDPVADVRTVSDFSQRLRHLRPDIVHTHMAKAGAVGRLAARRAGVPVIVHSFHGHVLTEYFSRPVTSTFLAAERALARRTDALVAVSEMVRDELLDLGVGTPGQWHVIPLGMELDTLLSTTPDPAVARDRLGLPSRGPLVGIVGRLVPIKDHVTFLEAAARVSAVRPDVSHLVAGDGELKPQLEGRYKEVMGSGVHWLGWVQDLPSLYGALDVVVLSSRNEGTPATLIEAAAAGRPVVATAVGGVRDVVRHGVTGLVVAPRNPSALAEAILALLEDPERGRAMGEAGRAYVRARFSAERLLADTADLYDSLLGRPRLIPEPLTDAR